MCGIAGYISPEEKDPKIIREMVRTMIKRGPDSESFHKSGYFSGGMRRLSVNGIENGEQPLFNEDRTIILFYNGEIYNSPKLRSDLQKKGHKFSSNSDGEVICHLWEEYQEDCVGYLDGMFAASIWLCNENKLILCRDLPGEKPLYYAQTSSGIAFASDLHAFSKFPELSLSLSNQAIWDFLTFLWIPEPQTVYEETLALPRGHYLTFDYQNGIVIKPYSFRDSSSIELCSKSDAIGFIRNQVEESVRSRLLSEVPLGCFLSGGLDSSIIATLMAKELDDPFDTFCIGFPDNDPYYSKKFDESPIAQETAKRIGSRHHSLQIGANDFKQSLNSFSKAEGQPFAVSSGLGVLAVSKVANEMGIKVLLSGDGADECFGGYSWYSLMDAFSSDKIDPLDPNKIDFSGQNYGLPGNQKLRYFKGCTPSQLGWASHYFASEKDKSDLFNENRFSEVKSSLRFFEKLETLPQPLKTMDLLRFDREFYLPQEMLRKADRMTMAHSVECRTPFTSPQILILAEQLEYDLLVKGKTLKWILREAVADLLPKDLRRRSKHGFNVPIDYWLKGEWYDLLETAFSSESELVTKEFVKPNAAKTAMEMLNNNQKFHGHTLFCLIMLNFWLNNYN